MDAAVDVFAYYDGFPTVNRDAEAHAIFKRFGAESVGSGCFIGGERDIQYRVDRIKAPMLIKQLKAADFMAKEREIPPPSAMAGTEHPLELMKQPNDEWSEPVQINEIEALSGYQHGIVAGLKQAEEIVREKWEGFDGGESIIAAISARISHIEGK